jgi:hypothetical protein
MIDRLYDNDTILEQVVGTLVLLRMLRLDE